MLLQVIAKFGQIDHNLPYHVFDDVICKPRIEYSFVFLKLPFLYHRRIIRPDELRAPDLFSVA